MHSICIVCLIKHVVTPGKALLLLRDIQAAEPRTQQALDLDCNCEAPTTGTCILVHAPEGHNKVSQLFIQSAHVLQPVDDVIPQHACCISPRHARPWAGLQCSAHLRLLSLGKLGLLKTADILRVDLH